MNKRDLLVRIDSEFQDKGFKSAEASAKAMVRELDRQEREVRNLANLQIQAQRENERRQAAQLMGMQQLGRGFTAMGLLAAAGLGLAAKAASDWESAWAGVTKTTDGSAEQMAELEGELRRLAKTLPATHEEIAAVAEEAGALGVARQDLAAFTKTAIDLGETTNLSANDAANGLARLGNVMGVLPKDADRAGAALVALGNSGASTEDEILAMAQRIAAAGRTIGLTEAEVLGFANALSSVGIEAEAGGSSISRVMVDIARAVRQGGDELDTFAQVAGMSADQFAAKFRDDAAGAITSFIAGLGKIQASGGDTFGVLEDLGLSEIRVRDALLRSAAASDLLTTSIETGSRAWEENSALLDEANKRYETAESRIQIARNQLNDAAIDIGGTVLPAFAGAAERVGFLAEAFQSLPDGAKAAVTWLGGAVGVISTLGGGALMAIPKLHELNATLAATGPRGAAAAKGLGSIGSALAGPWGLALAGATIALGIWAERQYDAKRRTEELTASLDAQTGAITGTTRAMVAAELRQRGLIDMARELGIASDVLVRAATGEADALAVLEQAAQRSRDEMAKLSGPTLDAADGTFNLENASLKAFEAQTRQADGSIYLLSQIRPLHDEITGLTADKRADAEASGTATTETEQFGSAMGETAGEAQRAREELELLIEAVENYGETLAEARDANRAYEGSLDDAADSLKKTREDMVEQRLKDKGFGTGKGDKEVTDAARKAAEEWADAQIKAGKALDITTEAGRRNEETLDAIAKKAKAAATANFENGMSVDDVTDKLLAAREQFVKTAVNMGMSEKAANALADELGLTRQNVDQLREAANKMPPSKTTVFNAKTEDALEKVRNFLRAVNSVPSNVRVAFEGTLPGGGKSTKGGLTFGSGGYTGDIPRDEVAGEVHGREFVNDADVTAKWRGLLEHMHQGGDPYQYLAGRQAPAAAVAGPTTHHETTNAPVHVTVQKLYAADLDGIVDQAGEFADSVGRNL